MPTSVYWEWLTSAGKEKYRNQAVPGRPSERNPFTGEPILTLSQGKYPEMHQTKSRVQIGNVVYNVASGRIERFVQPDTSGWAISPEVAARFLSVDPLTSKYPFYTPYQFAGNMPIQFIDLDGLEPAEPGSEKGEYQVANRQGTNKEFGYTWGLDSKGKGSWNERSKIVPAVNGTVTREAAQAVNGDQGDLVAGDTPQPAPFSLNVFKSNHELETNMLGGIVAGTTWQGDAAGRQLHNHFLNGGGTDLTLPNGSTLSSAIGSDERFLAYARAFENQALDYYRANGSMDGFNGNPAMRGRPGFGGMTTNLFLATAIGGTQGAKAEIRLINSHEIRVNYTMYDAFGAGNNDASRWYIPGLRAMYELQHYRNKISGSSNLYQPFLLGIDINRRRTPR